jgi:hypothetical protein
MLASGKRRPGASWFGWWTSQRPGAVPSPRAWYRQNPVGPTTVEDGPFPARVVPPPVPRVRELIVKSLPRARGTAIGKCIHPAAVNASGRIDRCPPVHPSRAFPVASGPVAWFAQSASPPDRQG